MLRITVTSCLFILLTCFTSLAQTEAFPEGLRKLSTKEVMDMGTIQFNDLPKYGPDGTLWGDKELKQHLGKNRYIPEYYADNDGKMAAIRYREITQEELEMMARFKERQARMEAMIGKEAEDFEVTDMEGNEWKLSELRGSVVAINFWFIGCKPCIMEMPELNEIVHQFEGKPVKFIAIALDKEDRLKMFGEEHQFDYDIVAEGKPVANLFEVTGYPTHLIVDKKGKIAYFKSGYSPNTADELTKTLKKLTR